MKNNRPSLDWFNYLKWKGVPSQNVNQRLHFPKPRFGSTLPGQVTASKLKDIVVFAIMK